MLNITGVHRCNPKPVMIYDLLPTRYRHMPSTFRAEMPPGFQAAAGCSEHAGASIVQPRTDAPGNHPREWIKWRKYTAGISPEMYSFLGMLADFLIRLGSVMGIVSCDVM